MKYVKILALVAVGTLTLMAFGAGSASATKLCNSSASTTACATDYASGTLVEGNPHGLSNP
jgi:hypothetical protein